MGYSGAWGKLIHEEKNLKSKTRVTFPLKHVQYTYFFLIIVYGYIF
jgi:hypothetical protein